MNRRQLSGWRALGILAMLGLLATAAMANSNTVSYQGVLRDATLTPVADDTYDMRFSLWDDPATGTKRWGDETQPVATRNGTFSVYLGSTLPLGAVFSQFAALWLQIEVDMGAGFEVYNPRVPLASVPYTQAAWNGVPLGTIIPVYIGLAGAPTASQLRAQGWATCDGTTPVSQGIADAAISATPDLNNTGRFIRGGTTAGTPQSDNVGTHGHTASFTGIVTSTAADHTHTFTATTNKDGSHHHELPAYWTNVNPHDHSGQNGKLAEAASTTLGGSGNTYTINDGTNDNLHDLHQHNVSGTTNDGGSHSHTVGGSVSVDDNSPGGETRPVNMSMVFFIKVK